MAHRTAKAQRQNTEAGVASLQGGKPLYPACAVRSRRPADTPFTPFTPFAALTARPGRSGMPMTRRRAAVPVPAAVPAQCSTTDAACLAAQRPEVTAGGERQHA